MYNNTFYKKQRSTTPKEKDLQLPGSGQTARQQSYKQTPVGYGGNTNAGGTSGYKSPSTSGYTSSNTGYKNNANSGYNSYNTGSTGSYKSPSTSSYTNSNTGYKNSANTGYKNVNPGYTSPAAGYKNSANSGYNSYKTGSTGGYTNSVDYGNAVAPVKPVGTVNPSMSAYKQPAAYPSANLPSAYSANTRYNAPANTAADNTALRSLSAAYKPAVQSPVSATNRLSGYSAPGKIPSPSLQSAYQSTNFPAQQSTLQKQQNIVNPLDNFAKHDKIKTETAPQKNYAAYQTAQAAQPAALTQKQRDAVHKQADTLDQLRILMQNRDAPPSEAYKKEMRALYSPDEWKVISGEMPANLWEKKQLERAYKDLSEARAAGIIPPDEEETVIPPYDLRERMQQIYTANQLPQFEKIPDDDPDRVQKLEEQVRDLSRLRWQMGDPNLRPVIEFVYRHDPDVLAALSGKKSDAELQLQQEKLQEQLWQIMEATAIYDTYGNKQYRNISLDKDGNLMLEPDKPPQNPWGSATTNWGDDSSTQVVHSLVTAHLPDPVVEKDPMVPEFSDKEIPLFTPTVIPATDVGGRGYEYAPQILNLSPELQKETYNMCRLAGVDYYLVLAIIAHESSSNPAKVNARYPTVQGLMQFDTDVLNNFIPHIIVDDNDLRAGQWNDEGKKYIRESDRHGTDHYVDNNAVRAVCNYAQSMGANMEDMSDPLAAVAYGIAKFCAHYKIAHDDLKGALLGYTGCHAANISEGIKEDFCAVREIIYYRNLLAEADGQEVWDITYP